jgi:hypothetical protein
MRSFGLVVVEAEYNGAREEQKTMSMWHMKGVIAE